MTSDEPTDGVSSAHDRLAEQIRRLRRHAGLSQSQLAALIGYSPQYVSLAERASKGLPSAAVVRAIDNALDAAGSLIRLRDHAESEQFEQRHAVAGLAESLADGVGRAAAPRGRDGMGRLLAKHDDGSRPGFEADSVLVTAADESSRFLSLAESTNVGELTVDQMHIDVRRVAHLYLKAPTWPMFLRICALRDRAFALLQGRQRPAQTQELYAVSGWALTMLAWMSVDLGRPDSAEDHARTAWACAVNADHNGLRAWVRATQHTAAFWQSDYARAAEYAADGLRYATGTARTFLASAHALDLARNGQADLARDALTQAQDAADRTEPNDEIGGPFTCARDRAASLWSDAYLAMGATDNALGLARDAVAAFEATPPEQRNGGSERMTRVQVVKAYIQRRELDGAADALAPVLATPSEHRVRPLVHRVSEVGTMVTAAGVASAQVARGMTAGVAEFCRHPARAELTP